MKNVLLLHGTGGNDRDYFWFGNTGEFLEGHGYNVWWPQLPEPDAPRIQGSLKFVLDNMPESDEDMIIIGHSSACPLILSVLQRLETPIKQAVLVGGVYGPIDDGGLSKAMLEPNYDWGKIKANAQEIVLMNSDNDPWGCTDEQARPVAEKIGRFVFMEGQGHMGSNSFNQPYREFPELKALLIV